MNAIILSKGNHLLTSIFVGQVSKEGDSNLISFPVSYNFFTNHLWYTFPFKIQTIYLGGFLGSKSVPHFPI